MIPRTPEGIRLQVVPFSHDEHRIALLYLPEKANKSLAIVTLHSSEDDALSGINLWLPPFLASKGYVVACPNKRNTGKLFNTSLFDWCEEDIGGVVNLLDKECQVSRIVLIGHSLGSTEAIYYQGKTQDKRIVALGIVGPGVWPRDIINKAKLDAAREHANDEPSYYIQSRNSQLVSARHYLSYWLPGSNNDVRKWIVRVSVPLLILGHSIRLNGLCNAEASLKLSNLANNSPKVEFKIIDGAPHSFAGHHEEVASIIIEWLDGVGKDS